MKIDENPLPADKLRPARWLCVAADLDLTTEQMDHLNICAWDMAELVPLPNNQLLIRKKDLNSEPDCSADAKQNSPEEG